MPPFQNIQPIDSREVKVLVTGYAPFLDKFPENSSWTIAASLPTHLPATPSCPFNIKLIVPAEPFRVAYKEVVDKVPSLLPEADLILHLGLAPGRTFFTLERQAARGPFDKYKDVDGKYFPEQEAKAVFGNSPQSLHPTLDCQAIWDRWQFEVKDKTADIRQGTEDSVGLYLCGFIYYFSLSWFWKKQLGERPVVFMHVPHLATEQAKSQGVEVAIGLIRAMVASRSVTGVYNPLQLHPACDQELHAIALQEKEEYATTYGMKVNTDF